MLTVSETCR